MNPWGYYGLRHLLSVYSSQKIANETVAKWVTIHDSKRIIEVWHKDFMIAQLLPAELRIFLGEKTPTRASRLNNILEGQDVPFSLKYERGNVSLYRHLGYERKYLLYGVQRVEFVKRDRAWYIKESQPFISPAY